MVCLPRTSFVALCISLRLISLNSNLLDSDVTHTVSVHLGEVLNPEATLYIYLIGKKGETNKVFLRPEELLAREKTYKFTLALTVDIGKVMQLGGCYNEMYFFWWASRLKYFF